MSGLFPVPALVRHAGGGLGLLVGLVLLILLVRLLEPTDFGVVGIAVAIVTLGVALPRSGVRAGLTSSLDDARDIAHTGTIAVAVTAALVWALVLLSARPVASLLAHPELEGVLRWMSLLVPIRLLAVVPEALAERGDGGRPDPAGTTPAALAVAVGGALAGLGLWSLVLGHLAGAALHTGRLLVRRLPPGWWARAHWSPGLVRDLLTGGIPDGLAGRLAEVADDLLVAGAAGLQALGYYRPAQQLCAQALDGPARLVVGRLSGRYTWWQHDPDRLAHVVRSGLRRTAGVVVPATVALLVLADDLVPLLLGERWGPMIPLVRLLAVAGLARSLSGVLRPVFTAVGRPGLERRGERVEAATFLAVALVLLPWGASGVAGAVAVGAAAGLLHDVHGVLRSGRTSLDTRGLAGAPARALAAGGIMAGAAVAAGSMLAGGPVGLVGATVAAAPAYLAGLAVFDPAAREDLGRMRRALRPGSAPSRPSPGLPETVARETVEEWAGRHLEAEVEVRTVEHLSSWKHAGAFRVRGTTADGRSWGLVWKEADYGQEHVPALRGLPVRPGPPEFAVYGRADRLLGDLLPVVHHCEELVPGVRYRYLLEDLAPCHIRLGQPHLGMLLAELLAGIHADLAVARPLLEPWLLDYDPETGRRLLHYVAEALGELAGTDPLVGGVLDDWERVRAVHLGGMERVYQRVEPTVVHGDLNPSNVWSDRVQPKQVRLVDWEWAGIGIPHTDLVAVLENATPDVERRALRRFHEVSGARSLAEDVHAYRWCKLQRALLNAGFLANQHLRTDQPAPRMGVPGVVRHSLALAHRLVRDAEQSGIGGAA